MDAAAFHRKQIVIIVVCIDGRAEANLLQVGEAHYAFGLFFGGGQGGQ